MALDPPHSAPRRLVRPLAAAREPGQDARFRSLILPHLDAAYSLARYLLRDATAAEDVVQEAFLRAFRTFDGYRGGDAKAWLLTIVRHGVYDHARAERGRTAVVVDSARFGDDSAGLEDIYDADDETPEQALVRRHEIQAVRSAIADLPEPFRETLVLRELEELSYREIAALTSAPIGTVMSRLARARALLAEALRLDGAGGPA
jgi:RNA polymerase sigma-70 factor (ECF subfamily)